LTLFLRARSMNSARRTRLFRYANLEMEATLTDCGGEIVWTSYVLPGSAYRGLPSWARFMASWVSQTSRSPK
jgi:hypothetical protein